MSRLWLKQKPIKIVVIITLALIISVPMILPHQAAAQTTQYYNKTFAWDYNGKHWTWNLSIPIDLYDDYKSVPVSLRIQNGPAGYGFCTTTQDIYIQSLAKELNETTTRLGYNSYDKVSFVLAFVQSLPYTSDSVTTIYDEYPRFPIETLVDDGGDCEDTSILFATITLIMGYGTVYINPPNHYAVGILGNNLHGTYWTYPEGSNKTYYYSETTGDGFRIGQLPDEFQNQKAYIYSIDENKQYVPPTSRPTPVDAASPTVTGPSVQPVLPLSFNLISDNPLLSIIIIVAIALSILAAVLSIRRPREKPKHNQGPISLEPRSSKVENTNSEDNKFCIFCGSINKTFAAYCEKCGKKIGSA